MCTTPPLVSITNSHVKLPVPGGANVTTKSTCSPGSNCKVVGATLNPAQGVDAVPSSVALPTFCAVYVKVAWLPVRTEPKSWSAGGETLKMGVVVAVGVGAGGVLVGVPVLTAVCDALGLLDGVAVALLATVGVSVAELAAVADGVSVRVGVPVGVAAGTVSVGVALAAGAVFVGVAVATATVSVGVAVAAATVFVGVAVPPARYSWPSVTA